MCTFTDKKYSKTWNALYLLAILHSRQR